MSRKLGQQEWGYYHIVSASCGTISHTASASYETIISHVVSAAGR